MKRRTTPTVRVNIEIDVSEVEKIDFLFKQDRCLGQWPWHLNKFIKEVTMITRIKTNGDINRYCGLSTDTKPTTDVPNGSTFYEIDTSDLYMYDLENGTWVKQARGCGESPSLKNVETYVLDFSNDEIVLTAGVLSTSGEYITT